jgi:hypothetical protein
LGSIFEAPDEFSGILWMVSKVLPRLVHIPEILRKALLLDDDNDDRVDGLRLRL